MKKLIKYTTAIIFFVIIIISGCASEKKEWDNTKQKNTIFAFEDFLKSYPKGLYSDSAKIYLESLFFQDAKSANTIKVYENFLKNYPQSGLVDSAQILLEKLFYRQAQELNTLNAYKNFIEKYPSSQLVLQARDSLISIEWESTKKINSIQSYKKFIAKYSESQFIKIAKVKIGNIELLKKCPFELVNGEIISIRNNYEGYGLGYTFEESKIKALESEGWLIQGLDGKLLDVEQKNRTGSYLGIYWIDQPFKVSYNGKFQAIFKNTTEYWKMLNE